MPRRHIPWSRAETGLLLAVLGLLALAVFGPTVTAPIAAHDFADRRGWLGIPHAGDVLSNLAFVLAGVWGLVRLQQVRAALAPLWQVLVALFFAGLLCTALGSGFYHWLPNDLGLALDRAGMAVAFAGVLGLAVAGRVGLGAGGLLALAMLVAAPLAIGLCYMLGVLRPWAVLQFGAVAIVLAMAMLAPLPGTPPIRLGVIVVLYGLAKLCELADHGVLDASAGWVSGHTLKHLLAAAAAWPVLQALRAVDASSH